MDNPRNASILDLPNDVVAEVAMSCTSRSVSALCQINRALNEAYIEWLYKRIYISTPRSLSSLLGTLEENKELAELVSEFTFEGSFFKTREEVLTSEEVRKVIRQIHDCCTKLNSSPLPEEPCQLLSSSTEFNLGAVRCGPDKLTHLELTITNNALYQGAMAGIEFSKLHSLFVTVDASDHGAHAKLSPESRFALEPYWFKMPKLRHFVLIDFVLYKTQEFQPPDSPLTVMQLLGGNYEKSEDFLKIGDPRSRFSNTLVSLTITAKDVSRKIGVQYSLESLQCLTKLCLPYQVFKRGIISEYPTSLETLVINGCYNKKHTHCERHPSFESVKNRYDFLKNDRKTKLPHLKCVRVSVHDAEKVQFDETLVKALDGSGIVIEMGVKHIVVMQFTV